MDPLPLSKDLHYMFFVVFVFHIILGHSIVTLILSFLSYLFKYTQSRFTFLMLLYRLN